MSIWLSSNRFLFLVTGELVAAAVTLRGGCADFVGSLSAVVDDAVKSRFGTGGERYKVVFSSLEKSTTPEKFFSLKSYNNFITR